MLKITNDFPGGNIEVAEICENEVILKNELRDTAGDWFYWAFCIEGAEGKTIRFKFNENNRVGYYGAAVSIDLENWQWTGNRGSDESFIYTFGSDEHKVYFAHHMLYCPERFFSFAKEEGLKLKELCISEKGRRIPCIEFGKGDKKIILTARHHACESTGSYFLEGVLEELIRNPVKGYSVFCVPFVDYDGVVDGDQGKDRRPHDHNRDYDLAALPLYSSVKAIRDYALSHEIVFGLDFHSPWHKGGRNDKAFIVQPGFKKRKNLIRFGELFEKAISDYAFAYIQKNDCPPDWEWNKIGTPSFNTFISNLPSSEFGCSVETPYFGEEDNVFSASKVIETGRCFSRALTDYISSQSDTVKVTFTGDLLCSQSIIEGCKTDCGYNFQPLFERGESALHQSDYVVGNLETPVAGEELKYSFEPYSFNAPVEYLDALRRCGVDMVCLANNHCMDRGEEGITRTLENCHNLGIETTGIYETAIGREKCFVKEISGVKISFVNYTYGTNAFAHKQFLQNGSRGRVNLTQPEETLEGAIHLLQPLNEIKKQTEKFYLNRNDTYENILKPYHKQIREDIKRAKDESDIVIFCLHSGGQYNVEPDAYTQMLTGRIREWGADIIIGLHPHIIQQCAVKDAFVTAFCLGNFMFSPESTKAKSEIDKNYNIVLHLYAGKESKKLTKVTFSLMYVSENTQRLPHVANTYDLYMQDSNEALEKEILYFANYFAADSRYTKVCQEYTLWESAQV